MFIFRPGESKTPRRALGVSINVHRYESGQFGLTLKPVNPGTVTGLESVTIGLGSFADNIDDRVRLFLLSFDPIFVHVKVFQVIAKFFDGGFDGCACNILSDFHFPSRWGVSDV